MLDLTSAEICPGRGRPREFDLDVVLDRAIGVFCERGYHAASIADLAVAMDLTTGSIYKAFKDKRGVFIAAFERYHRRRIEQLRQAVDLETGSLNRLRKAVHFYAELSHGENGRRGCLVVSGASELAILDPEIAHLVSAALDRTEKTLAELIAECQSEGTIRPDVDKAAAATFMLSVVVGMRLVGKTGRNRSEMSALVDFAMRAVA